MEDITLKIDGVNVTCPPGTSILDAAKAVGIKIPSLCSHPELTPIGACRLCLVEEASSGRVFASCVTPVAPEMVIVTDSDRVQRHRRNIVRLMMAEHPESCLVCSKGNRCELREIAAELGVGENKLYPMPNVKNFEQVNPFIVRDLAKCVLCGRCIRVDHELVVVGAIDYNLRGFECRPATLHDLPLEDSSCTFCGSCVSVCPTGALSTKTPEFVGTPEKESISICGFCGTGCSLMMGSVGEHVVEVNPSRISGSVNGATLCVRGHYGHDYLHSKVRLGSPLLRTGEEWKEITWDDALELAATKLREIKENYGPASLAFLGSSKCTNEENYLFQKMARVVLGTNNIDSGGYINGRLAVQAVWKRLGNTLFRKPLSTIGEADAILVLGADPTQSTPVAGYYIKRAAKNGLPLIEINPRKTGLSFLSSVRLEIKPNGDLAALAAILKYLVEKGWVDQGFISQSTSGFEPFSAKLLALDFGLLYKNAGIDARGIKQVCDLIKGKRISIVVGSGVLRQRIAVSIMNSIVDLALITGSMGERGGIYILAKDCNEMGAWDMGSAPDFLPGTVPVFDAQGRRRFERLWKAKLSPDPGLDVVRIIEEADKGRLKGLYIMGENPLRSLPDKELIKKGFEKLEFLIVQDILENETTQMAHLILPGAAAAEKEGSFTNMEGKIQSFEPVVAPPSGAMPDWDILDRLMALLGQPRRLGSISRIRREISQVVPGYGSLADGIGGWAGTGEVRGSVGPEAETIRIPFSEEILIGARPEDGSYPMWVVLGTSSFQMGCGTRIAKSRRITEYCPEGFAEVSVQDCDRLGLKHGDKIIIESKAGSVMKSVRVSTDQPEGVIFLPWGFDDNNATLLLGLAQFGGPNFEGWNSCRANIHKA
ncbi:MAG: hypothetical protein DRH11_13370 [Deltaproteobacteria bacterium]|nr:molybdopterin-dependent oxidoreductase [Deltaproteobacteria bacterium]RLB31389.1 MAG: hypothetical protein DRH11_13370 [Deltaproteobacteria bacterium]HDM09720.1 2Fe-2S iron-sulfur cluster binding domain-containing protein [Desulfobacteraceae bacterium]